ncbi:ATPase [Roseibium sp. RKSG952]|uniref:ATPase n=1 Tax=Roseibium sp. RKSG952 TaxID=2529384 RepID=UPI0012BCD744|nr:ATPase [Roseibium sp. RKSG952]MTH95537.1 ATPase [Roseibium sp. RKSG952]
MTSTQTQFTWRKSWEDRPNDGTGTHKTDPELTARVYLEPGGKQWYWVVNSWRKVDAGLAPTKESAIRAVDRAAATYLDKSEG